MKTNKWMAVVASAVVMGSTLVGGMGGNAFAATQSVTTNVKSVKTDHTKNRNIPPKGVQKWVYGVHDIFEITDFGYESGTLIVIGTDLQVNPDGIMVAQPRSNEGMSQDDMPVTNQRNFMPGRHVVESPLPLAWLWKHGYGKDILADYNQSFFSPQLAARLRAAHFPTQLWGMKAGTYPIAPPWEPVNAGQGFVNCPENQVLIDETLGYKVPLQGPYTPLYHPNNYSPYELWDWAFDPARYEVHGKKNTSANG